MVAHAHPRARAGSQDGVHATPSQIYAVVLDNPVLADEAYVRLLNEFGPNSVYRGINDTFLLVSSPQPGVVAQIAEAAELSGHCAGVVFPLATGYSGVAGRDLWSWLDERT